MGFLLLFLMLCRFSCLLKRNYGLPGACDVDLSVTPANSVSGTEFRRHNGVLYFEYAINLTQH